MDSYFVPLCFVIILVARYVVASYSSFFEHKALVSSGWWEHFNYTGNTLSDHCKWYGITCGPAGYVVEINQHGNYSGLLHSLENVNLSAFQHLTKLNITDGVLNGLIPSQIGALSELTHLNLSKNHLSGMLPLSLANLTKLQQLDLSYNSLHGVIPPEIGNLRSLFDLDLTDNSLNGPLPSTIGFLTGLHWLKLRNNRLDGLIPLEIGNLTRLLTLVLGNNFFNGSIPSTISKLTNLESLEVEGNEIVGPIPVGLGSLKKLCMVNLENNKINDTIPSRWIDSPHLEFLILKNNKLSGDIPLQIAKLSSIQMIDISRNSFSGAIPSELGLVPNAHSLRIDLSNNSLSGGLPDSLSNLRGVDLRNNHLSGPIPQSMRHRYYEGYLQGNPSLYVPVSPQTRHHRHRLKIFLPIVLFFACLFPCGLSLFLCPIKRVKKNSVITKAKEGDIFKIWNYDGKIAYEDIIEATADFDLTYCIGTGGYGSVYRAELPAGRIVAVKKLHKFEAENPTYEKCFKNEVKLLSGIRHRNIVKLFGYCLHNRCMFLIYDYMERGSLFSVLGDAGESVELDWMKRVNVVESIVRALSYMHHDCSPPILHRDISSNNILLDSEFVAHVGDFGTARLLDPNSSNQTLVAGTHGYIAPVHQK